MPWGTITASGVKQILGASQAGLQAYPVVVVDLHEIKDLKQEIRDLLEEGLRQLVAEKRLILGLEPQRWTLQTAMPKSCKCQGNCQNCPSRFQKDKKTKKESGAA